MVEGITGPYWLKYRHHARWKQEWFDASESGTYRWSKNIFGYVGHARRRLRSRVDIDMPIIAENGLSFIETSALDTSNVEAAFQNTLSGKCFFFVLLIIKPYVDKRHVDIYRIVSSKSIEPSTSNIEPPRSSINVGPSVNSTATQGSKCCWLGIVSF